MSWAMTLFVFSSQLVTYRAIFKTKYFMLRSRFEVVLTYLLLHLTRILRRRISEGKALFKKQPLYSSKKGCFGRFFIIIEPKGNTF